MVNTQRVQQLDILRTVAILLVLFRHMNFPPAETLSGFSKVAFSIFESGWVGVDLFFVLSGFLVSGLLFREYSKTQQIDIKRFLLRRVLKIYPAFFIFISITVAIANYQQRDLPFRHVLNELLFIQNYFYDETTGFNLWAHSWSLAVEAHFYILLVIIVFILSKNRQKSDRVFASIPKICIGIGLVVLGFRFITNWISPFITQTHLFPTHLRIDALLFGVFLSYLFFFKGKPLERFLNRFKLPLLILSVLLVLPGFTLPVWSFWLQTVGLTSIYLGFGLLMILSLGAFQLSQQATSSPLIRFVTYMGSHSYSIYLWHMPFKVWGLYFLTQLWSGGLPYPIESIVYIVGSIIFGTFMSLMVEFPILYIRDRIFPSRSNRVSAPNKDLTSEKIGDLMITPTPRLGLMFWLSIGWLVFMSRTAIAGRAAFQNFDLLGNWTVFLLFVSGIGVATVTMANFLRERREFQLEQA